MSTEHTSFASTCSLLICKWPTKELEPAFLTRLIFCRLANSECSVTGISSMWKPKSTQRGELEQGFIGVGDTRRVRLMERKEKLAWRKKTSPARCLSVKILFYWWLTSGVFIILALCLTLIRFYPHQQLQDSGILKTASWIKLLFLINKLLILFFFFFSPHTLFIP